MHKFLLSFILIFTISSQTFAQCCSAGNPSANGSTLGVAKNHLTVSTSFLHGYSSQFFQGTKLSDENYKSVQLDFNLFKMVYGLSDKVQLSAELGYFPTKKVILASSDMEQKAFGIGDAVVGMQYHLYSNKYKMFDIAPSVRVTLPVGVFDQVVNNVKLPIDLQPSSGGFKLNTSVWMNKRFFGSKFTLSSFLSAEFSQRINTDRTDYKYGDLYNASIKTTHQTNSNLSTGLSVQFQHRKKAINYSNILHATGGNFINLIPSIAYTLNNNLSAFSMISLPIYRNVNDLQLTNNYTVSIGISKGFNLAKLKPQIDYTVLESLHERTFYVDGICGMCKERIEALAYKVKEVKWAEWDLATKTLTVKYKDTFDKEKLAKTIAKGGHDNWLMKANEKAYQSLHSCCKYRTGH